MSQQGLGAFFDALGRGGMQLAEVKIADKNRALQAALERERLEIQRQSDLQAQARHTEQMDFSRGQAEREDQRALDNRGFQQAQFMAQNFGGQEDIPVEAANLLDKYLPGSTTRSTKLDPGTPGGMVEGLPHVGTFRESRGIRETMPSSVRNALTKAESDAHKLAAQQQYQAERLKIDALRAQIAQQRVNLTAEQNAQAERMIALAEQKALDDYNLRITGFDVSMRNTDARVASGQTNPMGLLQQFAAWDKGEALPGQGGVKLPPKVALPAPRVGGSPAPGGGVPATSIDSLTQAILEYLRRSGGGG